MANSKQTWRSDIAEDWVAAVILLYVRSSEDMYGPMKKAMLAYCLKDRHARNAAKNSTAFKALILQEPMFAQDWAIGLIEMNVTTA